MCLNALTPKEPPMRFLPLAAGLLLLSAVAAAAQTAPIATRQQTFSIPFRVGKVADPSQQPVEVQLYVSEDRGATWKLHSRVSPQQQGFNFSAPHDGYYAFLVRTRDRAGQLLPQRPPAAELEVVVDTSLPAMDLKAVRGPSGEVSIRWHVADATLQPSQIQIEYQAEHLAEPWQRLALDPSKTQITATTCTGELTWWPPAQSQPLMIRAEAIDAAGNRATAQVQVASAAPTVAARPAAPQYPQSGSASPGYPSGPAAPQTGRWSTPATPANTSARLPSQPPPGGWRADSALQGFDRSTNAPETALPARQQVPWPSTPGESPIVPVRPSGQTEASSPPPPYRPWEQPPLTDVRRDAASRPANPPGEAATPIDPGQAVHQPESPRTNGTADPWDSQALSTVDRPRMVNSRTFHLDYDIESVGPWGIRKVELWGTRDAGRTWHSYGIDGDHRSPLTATVEGEGLYGFRILVQSAGSLPEQPPQPGARPEILVGVDLSRPVCRITQAEQGTGERSAELYIAWEASDRLPAERPISLWYGPGASGPWTPIASGLENTGRYTWLIDTRVPEQFYLRLEMRDEAGNVEAHQSPSPITLARLRPKGRIRDVRPAPVAP
jgi:hypothetical protein